MFKLHTIGENVNVTVFVMCAVLAFYFRLKLNTEAAQTMLFFMLGWSGIELVKYALGRK